MGVSDKNEVSASNSDVNILRDRGFMLEKMIGEGSYAKVYKASHVIDETRHVTLACKCIDTSLSHHDYTNKFLPRELDILIRLNHPNIIKVISILQRRAKYFIFLRFAEKGDLLDFLAQNGKIAERQARLWFRQLMSALQYMHASNAAHRDLKCENILITTNYNVKITDFGFARFVKQRDKEVLSDTFCGSLSYAAPEILKGAPYLPRSADMWSMGVILYTMLNKALPFNETSVKKLYEKQVTRKWRFRSNAVTELSSECKQQVVLLMEPDPKLRPTSAQVMGGAWIAMDRKLASLTFLEESLLKAAQEEDKKMDLMDNCEADRIAELRRKGRAKEGLKVLKDTDTNNLQSQQMFQHQ